VCARGPYPTWVPGPSTSPLGVQVSASVQPSEGTSPPAQVRAALGLMAVAFAVVVLRSALMQNWARPTPAFLNLFILAAICAFWLYGLWRRLNWLRWVTVFLGTTGCLLASRSLARLHDPTQIALYLVQFAVTAPTVILLVLPPARRWYTRDLAA
jgi:UDP-N-acetylmuramyl pentapeptide phosphotransferase/UDP-N-acetylglucosamine-1-phosphate transferase